MPAGIEQDSFAPNNMNKRTLQSKRLLFALWLLALMPSVTHVYAQQPPASMVTGIIKNEKGDILPGVSVKALQTTGDFSTVTTSNGNGIFSFAKLPAGGPYSFIFSSVGYETDSLSGYTVKEGGKITLSVTLRVKSNNLDNVVVVGYGKSSRRNVTGAITSVSSEEFNQGVISSPAQLLQGKVPGLNITKSGDPNGTPAVILRGPSTLREGAAQEPFYVIDGVPGASIDLVAPDDILSIDVLKDASATAIYGSRASNGVIIITTRKARSGQLRLAYNAYVAQEKVSKRINMLTGDELRSYLAANGQSLSPINNDAGVNTDWQNEVQRTAVSHNHNIAFGGGTDKTLYGASVNYLENPGIMKGSSLKRVILRANVEQKYFNDRLKLNLSLMNSTSTQKNIPADVYPNMLKFMPTVGIKRADGSYTEDFSRGSYLNPVSLIDNNINDVKVKTMLVNAVAEVKILKNLTYTLSYANQSQQVNQNIYYNSRSGIAQGASGKAIRSAYEATKNVIESYFNYDQTFDRHNVKLLAGYSWQEDRTGDGFGVSTQGFVSDALTYNNLAFSNPPAGTVTFANTTIGTLRLISYYLRANYAFNNKYLVQASLRQDGSSAFGTNNKWGYFPSVSAGWRISNESFMKSIAAINELKLRVGYGVSGNSLGFDPLLAQLQYGINGRYYSNGQLLNAIGPVQNANPDLKWESTAMTNIGLDFSILKNRISGSLDFYNKRTSDLIWNYPVSSTQYFVSNLWANVGEISNRGIELILNITPVQTKSFTWRTTFNMSHNTNKVNSLSSNKFALTYVNTAYVGGKGQSSNWSQIVKEGSPIGTFTLWHYLGKDANGVTLIQKADGTATQAPSTSDYIVAGNAQPKMMYGWSNSFTYKNFDLNFFFRGVTGNKILNATLAGLNSPSDAKNNNIPKFTLGESYNDDKAYLISDRFLESGSYLRLDNATLGYTVRTGVPAISKLRFYASANNLFVITKYRGIDPEVNMGGLTPGIDNNNYYPKTRSFIAGVNVSF